MQFSFGFHLFGLHKNSLRHQLRAHDSGRRSQQLSASGKTCHVKPVIDPKKSLKERDQEKVHDRSTVKLELPELILSTMPKHLIEDVLEDTLVGQKCPESIPRILINPRVSIPMLYHSAYRKHPMGLKIFFPNANHCSFYQTKLSQLYQVRNVIHSLLNDRISFIGPYLSELCN